jgi:hypothetical protein
MSNINEKLTKLLRLAQRADGPEAELALFRAKQLATEHDIDMSVIDITEGEVEKKEAMFRQDLYEPDYKEYLYLNRLILCILRSHFKVKSVFHSYSGRIELVGRHSDVIFGAYLMGWLRDHFKTSWKNELKRPGEKGKRRTAKPYWYGMYRGLDDKLTTAKNATETSKINEVATTRSINPNDVKQTYQLAVVKETDELEAEYRKQFPCVRSHRLGVNHNRLATERGLAAGRKISLPGMPLNNSTNSALR